MKSFFARIQDFNKMYGLPCKIDPVMVTPGRLQDFKSIMEEELKEFDDVKTVEDYADLLGDIVVYCTSEALRHGIPLDQVLDIIMSSNASKLGADGKPILDERNKVMKGPNYWKPEPRIKQHLDLLKKKGHQWSGWPGAYCLKCGADHMLEMALAEGWVDCGPTPENPEPPNSWTNPDHHKLVDLCDGNCYADMTFEEIEIFDKQVRELCEKLNLLPRK